MASRKLFVDVELKGAQKATKELKGIEKQGVSSTKAISTGFIAATAAVAGLAIGLRGLSRALGSTIAAYNEQEQAEARLVAGLTNVGDASDATTQSLFNQASALQSLTGVSDGLIISAQGMLSSFMLTGEEIQVLTPRLLDMAAGTAKVGQGFGDIEAIAMAMGKALSQGDGALGRYGVVLTDVQREAFNTAEGLDKINILAEILDGNFAGMAAAMGDTYAGETRKFAEAWGDITEEIGEVLSEGILPLIQGARDLLKQWNELDEGTKRVNITFGLYVTGAVVLVATIGTLILATKALIGAFGYQAAAQVAVVGTTGIQTVATDAAVVATREQTVVLLQGQLALIEFAQSQIYVTKLIAKHIGVTLDDIEVTIGNTTAINNLDAAHKRIATSIAAVTGVTEVNTVTTQKSTAYRLGATTSTHGYVSALRLLNVEIHRSIVAQGGLWAMTKKLGHTTVVSAAAVSGFAFVAGGAYLMALHASEKVTNELRESAKELRKEYEQLGIETVELEKDTFDLTNEIKRSIKYGRDSADAFYKLKDKVVEYMEANPELQDELDITIGLQDELYDINGDVITSLDQLQIGFNSFSTANMRDELFKAAEAALKTADTQLQAAQASLPWYRMFAHTKGWFQYNETQVISELEQGREQLRRALGGMGGLGGAPIVGGITGDIYATIQKPLETEAGRKQFQEFWLDLSTDLKSQIGMEKGFEIEKYAREEALTDKQTEFLELMMDKFELQAEWLEYYQAPGFGGAPTGLGPLGDGTGPRGTEPDPIFVAFKYPDAGGGLIARKPGTWMHGRYISEPGDLAQATIGLPPGAVWGRGGEDIWFESMKPSPTATTPFAGIRGGVRVEHARSKMTCEIYGGVWDESTQTCQRKPEVGQPWMESPQAQMLATAGQQVYQGQYGQAIGGVVSTLTALGPFAGLAGMIVGDVVGGLFEKKQKPQAMGPVKVEVVNFETWVDLFNVSLSNLVRGSGLGITALNQDRLQSAGANI